MKRNFFNWKIMAIVLVMGIFVTSEVFAAYIYTASPSSTTNGGSIWGNSYLKLSVSISGSSATFTVSKADGGNFTNNGTLYLKVGSYEPSGFDRGSSSVSIGNPPVTFKENLDDPNLSYKWVGNTLEYFVRDEIVDPPNPNGSRWAWVGPITITRQVVNQPTDVSFNYTTSLSWKDYKRVANEYSATGLGTGWPSCESEREERFYIQNIPFRQNVSLEPFFYSDDCRAYLTSYHKVGDLVWTPFTTNQTLPYEGDLELYVYANSNLDCGRTMCSVGVRVLFYDKMPTTDQQKTIGSQFASIPIKKARQELTRIPVPKSQFEDPKLPNMGVVRELKCTTTTDNSSDVAVWCEQQGNEFVVYAYPKAAIDEPMAPFASIASIRSSGKKVEGGVEVIKAVKWKDDEFDTKHDIIEFVGQATDIDGSVVEYLWEADGQLLNDKLTFFYSDFKLGRHMISFKAKDNSGLWSTVSTKVVDVVKPPVLMVHGYHDTERIWDYSKDVFAGYYPVKSINIDPNDQRISYGAEKISTAVKELAEEYGVPKVDILAYDMGGLNSRWYIQSPGYRNDVNKLVMIATPNHGSTLAIFVNPDQSGVHENVYKIVKDIATAIWAPLGSGLDFLSKTGESCGPAAIDLIPGSPALRQLNGNKKDEGFKGDESADNIRSVYGNNVQYFSIYGTGWPSITHWHFDIEILGFHIYNYDFVLPTLSLDTDMVVSSPSAKLDSVPDYGVNGVWHFGMHSTPYAVQKALYFFGDDQDQPAQPAMPNTDITKTLAAHPIFAPENGEYSTVSSEQPQEQKFNVDAGIRNITVMLMPPVKEGETNLLSLRLIAPSGEIIDENTDFPDVKFNPQTMVYQIFNAEAGEWTAEISTISGIPLQYALLVMGETDFWIGVREEGQSEPGKPIMITAYTQKEGKPAPGLKVKASVRRTFDEGERIGSKYGKDLKDAEPEEVELTDLGDGRYEVNYTNTLASGVYRVFVTATDPASNVSRMAFTTFFVEYSYDFSIQSDDISFSNDSPEGNEMITVSATVHNNTPLEAKGVEVIFSDGSLGNNGKEFGKTVIDLPANGSTDASLSWRIPAGLHDVFVIVSPMNTFIEENIQNNIASRSLATPDRSPTANAGGKERISRFNVGKSTNYPIVMDASGSTDDLRIEKYEWDMNTKADSNGDGVSDNDADFTGVRAVIPEGTFTAEGDYQIKLTVTDSKGQKSSDTMTIHLKDAYDFEAPKAYAGRFQTIPAAYPIRFDGSASTDNFGIVAYMWDTDINTDSNGDGIKDNDVDLIGMKPVLESGYPSKGIYTAKLTVSDAVGNLASGTVKVLISDFKSGIFTTDESGIVKIDWLYDGGMYKGEFGIFSLTGMEDLTPGSAEFIAEAVKRVMSNSEQGYLAFSDLSERARFSGKLGNEAQDWNAGQYKGLKSFAMKPGDKFATILVPNSTFAELAGNPATTDSHIRPLFSLVSDNPGYGTHIGQMADINGMGKAFAYEDMDAATSDWDYNDLIVQIIGAESDLPTLDSLVGKDTARSKRAKRDNTFTDWRVNSELGKLIMAHIEALAPADDALSLTVTLKSGQGSLLIYDSQDHVIGKDGGTMIGSELEMNTDGSQTVSLGNLNPGDYRIVIRSTEGGTETLEVRLYEGNSEISSQTVIFDTASHRTMTTAIPADSLSPDQPITVETPKIPVTAAGRILYYDFNGDGRIDDTDTALVTKLWNCKKGEPCYDPFYDFDNDGRITVSDIMKVSSQMPAVLPPVKTSGN